MKVKAKNVQPGDFVKLTTADGKEHEFVVKETHVDDVMWTTTEGDRYGAQGEEEIEVERG
jgi:hypothetical protein